MRNYPGLDPSVKLWFEGVEPPRTHVPVGLVPSVNQWVEGVEPYDKLSCRLGSLNQTVVREGSKRLNHSELM